MDNKIDDLLARLEALHERTQKSLEDNQAAAEHHAKYGIDGAGVCTQLFLEAVERQLSKTKDFSDELMRRQESISLLISGLSVLRENASLWHDAAPVLDEIDTVTKHVRMPSQGRKPEYRDVNASLAAVAARLAELNRQAEILCAPSGLDAVPA